MDTQNKANQRLNEAAKIVWEQMGHNENDLLEVTPDNLRQWMPETTNNILIELLTHKGQGIDQQKRLRQMPKDPEPDNWQAKVWYRIKRCSLQHTIDVPTRHRKKTILVQLPNRKTKTAEIETAEIVNVEETKPRTIMDTAFIAILSRWNDEDDLIEDYFKDFKQQEGISTLEDGIVAIHNLWVAVNDEHEGEFKHPIEPMVEAYLQETTAKHISKEYDRKHPVAILQRDTMGSIRDMPNWTSRSEDLGQLRVSAPAPKNEQIPLFEMETILPPVLPMEYIHMAEEEYTTKKGHVAMPIRLFLEAVMALEPKETRADIHFKLGDLLQYLNPDGKFHRTNHLPHVLRGLHSLYYLRIPYRSNRDKPSTEVDWIPVLPRTVPSNKSGNDASIILEVRLPPDAAGGMMVEKENLRLTGKKSSARFNAYLTACWIFDKYGTRNGKIIDPTKPNEERRDSDGYLITEDGNRIYGKTGNPLKHAYNRQAIAILDRVENEARKHYPTLSFDELARACYSGGFDKRKQATYMKRALKAWEALETDGIVKIEKFSHGWRIMPSDQHIQLYRAIPRASKKSS